MATGMSVGYAQSRTSTFYIAAGVSFAIGAYCAAILLVNGIVEIAFLLPASMLCAGLAGGLVATITVFHDRRVLDIIGLALLLAGGAIVRSWYSPDADAGSWQSLTNGSFGLSGFSSPTLFGIELSGAARLGGLITSSLALAASYVLIRFFEKSLWGASITAIKDNRLQAAIDGHHIPQRQVIFGFLCAATVGGGGAAFTLTFLYVDPSVWSLQMAIGICLIPMIWPTGSFFQRAFIGSVAFVMLPEVLSAMNVASPYESYLRNIIFFCIALFTSSYLRSRETLEPASRYEGQD